MNVSSRLRSVIRSKIAGEKKELSEQGGGGVVRSMVQDFKRKVTHQF